MKRALLLFSIAVLKFSSASVFGFSVIIPVTPRDPHTRGLDFDITAENTPEGPIRFRVVVSGKGVGLGGGGSPLLGSADITPNSEGFRFARALSHEIKNDSVTCIFSVSQTSLDDPNLCFVFTPSGYHPDRIYAKLNDFVNPPPLLSSGKARIDDLALEAAERTHIDRLEPLDIEWDRRQRSALFNGRSFNPVTFAKAKSSLRALDCKILELTYCDGLKNAEIVGDLTGLTGLAFSIATTL